MIDHDFRFAIGDFVRWNDPSWTGTQQMAELFGPGPFIVAGTYEVTEYCRCGIFEREVMHESYFRNYEDRHKDSCPWNKFPPVITRALSSHLQRLSLKDRFCQIITRNGNEISFAADWFEKIKTE